MLLKIVPQKLTIALQATTKALDLIAEQATLLNLEQENQENTAIRNYALLTLMDSLLFYKCCYPIFLKLFTGIIQLMETIQSQISYPDIKLGSEYVISVIETIQRLYTNYLLVDQYRDKNTQHLKLSINTKKLELQNQCLRIQNDKLQKWQLYESNTFILKHFDTKNADPQKLYTDILYLEDQENKTQALIQKCEDNFRFLSIPFIDAHRNLLNSINDIYRVIHKLQQEVSDERLFEFIQDSKIDLWKSNAQEFISLSKDAISMYNSYLGTIERLQMRIQEQSMQVWGEVQKQQQVKQLVNEIRSVILYSQAKFPLECRQILDIIDTHPMFKKSKIVVS